MSMHDCETQRADTGGPNVREAMMNACCTRRREKGEQEAEVERFEDVSRQNEREIRIDVHA